MSLELTKFQQIEKIGEGTYGEVYKAKDIESNSFFALKKIRLDYEDEGIPSTAIREVSILKELKHPNIVNLHKAIYHNKQLYLIFEYLDLDLKKYLDGLRRKNQIMDPYLVKSYLYQILRGIQFIHSHRIIHRDLKPANLLIDREGNIKLADFGLARTISFPINTLTHEVITLWYRAPEIILGAKHYSMSIDIWSVGCIFAEMASGKSLFPADSEIDLLYKIFQVLGTPTENEWPGVSTLPHYKDTFPNWNKTSLALFVPNLSNEGIDLLEKMLVYPPNKRISAKEAINHPYFDDLDKSQFK